MIRVFDAFSGIGGFRSGLMKAGGYEFVGWCEIDRFAQQAYRAIYETGVEAFYENIRDIDTDRLTDFTIDEYGVVTVGSVTANVFTEDGIPGISMVDDATIVKISKQDITTGAELPGATLQVIDKDGNIIEEWISTTETHYIETKLIAGETYTLREITAPNGYKVATDITFTVNEDGTVTEVVMKDEAITIVVTTTPSGGSTYTTVNPPTGDPGRSPIGLIMLIAGIGGLLYVSAKCRKKDRR